jgi:hypothetical protein
MVSDRKKLDWSIKMNALSNCVVKIEKQILAPAPMIGGHAKPLLNTISLIWLSIYLNERIDTYVIS